MNYVISIINPDALELLHDIHRTLELPVSVTLIGHGTAVRSMLDLLGIESTEKRVVISVANTEKTKKLISEQKRRLFIGVPGHGIVITIPIKSIGGGQTVAYLNGGDAKGAKYTPNFNFPYELIIAIANEGRTDMVMNAARAAGATGGTVLHGKGTVTEGEKNFLGVSIAHGKEVILIVAKSEKKSEIMRSIVRNAGPSTEAGAIAFSLPTSEVAGFGMIENSEQEKVSE